MEVPYPPPAARVDVVPNPPYVMKHAVWIDGQWMWHGRRWIWEAGQWIDLAPDQFYARPTMEWLSDGRLVWFAGSLRRKEEATSVSPVAQPSATAAVAPSNATGATLPNPPPPSVTVPTSVPTPAVSP
jgi:hypothetical protein